MHTRQDVVITLNGTTHHSEYRFPLTWALAILTATTLLTTLGIVAIQAGWLR